MRRRARRVRRRRSARRARPRHARVRPAAPRALPDVRTTFARQERVTGTSPEGRHGARLTGGATFARSLDERASQARRLRGRGTQRDSRAERRRTTSLGDAVSGTPTEEAGARSEALETRVAQDARARRQERKRGQGRPSLAPSRSAPALRRPRTLAPSKRPRVSRSAPVPSGDPRRGLGAARSCADEAP